MQLAARMLLFCLLPLLVASPVWADAVDRLKPEKLQAVREAVAAFESQWQAVEIDDGYDDFRALLHVHSHFSHDSRGTLEEILAAAKATGVRAILFTEHPSDEYDYYKDGHRGMHDGVLLIPGAETMGFLAYPTRSIQQIKPAGPQEFVDLVRRDGGLAFLSHLEERMDWEIAGLTGTEIYNTHADAKEERRLMARLRNPLALLSLLPIVEKYPQEFFGALLDYPADYLRRWDELCLKYPHTGVAANDSHHNQGIRAVLEEQGRVRVEDLLGKKIIELDGNRTGFLKPRLEGKKPGDVVLEIDLDPYERSFRHVSTHLLMNELSREAVWEALEAGRAYVGFDWIADPTGFVFFARQQHRQWPMGSRPVVGESLTLIAAAPLPGTFRVVRNGEVIHTQTGRSLELPIDQPGNYRVEVLLPVADETRPWILSNPIYVKGS